jgi:hypothetical protein
LILAEELPGAGDQQPVSGLALPALAGLDDPTQARRGFADPEGINEVLAAEIRRNETFASEGVMALGHDGSK